MSKKDKDYILPESLRGISTNLDSKIFIGAEDISEETKEMIAKVFLPNRGDVQLTSDISKPKDEV